MQASEYIESIQYNDQLITVGKDNVTGEYFIEYYDKLTDKINEMRCPENYKQFIAEMFESDAERLSRKLMEQATLIEDLTNRVDRLELIEDIGNIKLVNVIDNVVSFSIPESVVAFIKKEYGGLDKFSSEFIDYLTSTLEWRA